VLEIGLTGSTNDLEQTAGQKFVGKIEEHEYGPVDPTLPIPFSSKYIGVRLHIVV
jgi:hypothetical protein